MSLWGILLIIAPVWFAVTIALAIVVGRSVQRADAEELSTIPAPVEASAPSTQRLAG